MPSSTIFAFAVEPVGADSTRGEELFSQGKAAEAITCLNRAILQNPNDYQAYLRRGLSQEQLASIESTKLGNRNSSYVRTNYQKAADDFSKAIQLKPNQIDAYLYRGDCRSSLDNSEGALSDFNKAVQLNPNSSSAYARRAAVYSSLRPAGFSLL